jgi:hypothetical protein
VSFDALNFRLMLPELRTRRLASADLLQEILSHKPVGLSVSFVVKLKSIEYFEFDAADTDLVFVTTPPGWINESPTMLVRVGHVEISRR